MVLHSRKCEQNHAQDSMLLFSFLFLFHGYMFHMKFCYWSNEVNCGKNREFPFQSFLQGA